MLQMAVIEEAGSEARRHGLTKSLGRCRVGHQLPLITGDLIILFQYGRISRQVTATR